MSDYQPYRGGANHPYRGYEATCWEDWLVLGEIGPGRVSELHDALPIDIARGSTLVALRRLWGWFDESPEFRAMFLDDIRYAATVVHQNLCRTYLAGEHDQRLYCVTERVWGLDLGRIISSLAERGAQVPLALATAVAAELCHALSAIHRAGGVHRGVHPRNVVLSFQGDVKLTDFGLTRIHNNAVVT